MEHLRITLIQPELYWEDRGKNLAHLEKMIRPVEDTDLIVLPEMFSTGFSMQPEHNFEAPGGEALEWMQGIARSKDAAVSGSVIVKDRDRFYNRLYFVRPDGEFSVYDKKHLFTLAGEEKVYAPGMNRLLVTFRGWKILPFICYDLRFPVWCRNTEEADLMLFVANWPERRNEAWKTLLRARAIENMCYVAGVNRVGEDGNGVDHSGDSGLYDELGELLSDFKPGKEAVKTFTLDRQKVHESRTRFSFLKDRDSFALTV